MRHLTFALKYIAIVSVTVAVIRHPFPASIKHDEFISGQYLIFFDTSCLANSKIFFDTYKQDVIADFLRLFTCYRPNTEFVDMYPTIGNYFIVVNKLCNDNDDMLIEFDDYCIAQVHQDRLVRTCATSECECVSRNVDPFVLWNLDSLTPQVTNGFECVRCTDGYDPGFDIIVMDTGINPDHEEFSGIIYERIFDAYPGVRLHWHGTHVAGTIVGKMYGAFKAQNTRIKLLDVRFLPAWLPSTICDATNGYKAIIDYLQKNPRRKAIINLSFRYLNDDVDLTTEFDRLLAMIRQYGGIMFAAAGNWEWVESVIKSKPVQSCLVSPASSSDTITVGALDRQFTRAPFSNFGECVNIWAPGTDITSAYEPGGSFVSNGTSMASPLIAGVAANILSVNPQFNFDDIKGKLLSSLGSAYDVNFNRLDINESYFPMPDDNEEVWPFPYFAPVTKQPRIQASCELYGILNERMQEHNRYGYSDHEYGRNVGNTERMQGYDRYGYQKRKNRYVTDNQDKRYQSGYKVRYGRNKYSSGVYNNENTIYDIKNKYGYKNRNNR